MKVLDKGLEVLGEKLWGVDDARRLRLFEIAYVLQYLAWEGLLFLHPFDWLGVNGFHVSLEDQNRGYWAPWPRLPDWGIWCFGLAMFGGSGLVLFNRFPRLGLWILLACAIYVQYADTPSAFSINRLYIIVFAILATAPPRFCAPDGRLLQSLSPSRLLQALVIIVYFFAGFQKIVYGNWLANDDVVLSFMQGIYRTDVAAWLVRVMPPAFWVIEKYLALGFELGAPILFTVPRLRPMAIILGIGFHLTIATCFWTIWPFALQMVTFYILFLPEPAIDRRFRLIGKIREARVKG